MTEAGFARHFKTHFIYAALFSFFVNLALRAPPLLMIQVFDRVLVSRSNETLVMLALGTAGILAVMMALDYLRALLLLGAGGLLDHLLGDRVINRLIENGSRAQPVEQMHGLKDVAVLRNFLTGNSICIHCGCQYTTAEPKQHGYSDDVRKQALQLHVDGMNLRRIARHLGIHHRTVSLWVKAGVASLPEAPGPKEVKTAEMEELFTFIGNKKTGSTSSRS